MPSGRSLAWSSIVMKAPVQPSVGIVDAAIASFPTPGTAAMRGRYSWRTSADDQLVVEVSRPPQLDAEGEHARRGRNPRSWPIIRWKPLAISTASIERIRARATWATTTTFWKRCHPVPGRLPILSSRPRLWGRPERKLVRSAPGRNAGRRARRGRRWPRSPPAPRATSTKLGKLGAAGGDQRTGRPLREQQPGRGTDEGEQHALGQELADQARAAGAQGHPDRPGAPLGGRPGQQQAGRR